MYNMYIYERDVERPLVTDEIKRFLIKNKQKEVIS